MTRATKDMKLSDRELIRMTLAAQKEIANILASLSIALSAPMTAIKAQELYRSIDDVLKGVPSEGHVAISSTPVSQR